MFPPAVISALRMTRLLCQRVVHTGIYQLRP